MPQKVTNSRSPSQILDIPFQRSTLNQTIKIIQEWLNKSKNQYHVATPNPEILLKTLKSPQYKKIIQNTNLNIADGIGILWAANYQNSLKKTQKTQLSILITYIKGLASLFKLIIQPSSAIGVFPERVTGTDLMNKLIEQISKNSRNHHNSPKIFLLGAQPGIAAQLSEKYQKMYPTLQIVDTYSGSPSLTDEQKIISKVNQTQPTLLFVAFGAPDQEIWINRNLNKMPSVKVAIGVGGAFDFLSGHTKRAPKWMRKLGLEWLYRLIKQPYRIKRIINATIIFPLTIIKNSQPPKTE